MENVKLFKNAEPLVKEILAKYPETRGDDIELIIKVWEYQGLKFTDTQKYLLRKCYSPETIRRNRQKIQEIGLFRPSENIQKQRSFLEEEYRSTFRHR